VLGIVSPIRLKVAELLLELREGVEISEKSCVIALHDDGSREKERPSNGFGVEANPLQSEGKAGSDRYIRTSQLCMQTDLA
jgi:hypothetical protein